MPYIGGNYSGLNFVSFKAGVNGRDSEIDAADSFLEIFTASGDEDRVVSIFTMPKDFSSAAEYDPDYSDEAYWLGYDYSPDPKTVEKIIPIKNTVDEYKPRNNKLFTYPFNYLTVDSLNGSVDYRWERFNTYPTIKFAISCAMSCNPEIVCYPENYNGSTHNSGGLYAANPTEVCTIDGFPQSPYIIDGFRAWLAGKGASFSVNPISLVTGAIQGIHTYRQKGTATSNSNVSLRNLGFYFKYMCVNREQAEIIDNYFDRYGYACRKVKTPNRNVRENWTYTQTKDVSIIGDIPIDAMSQIKDIYNNGITFWNKTALVGDYTQPNNVL